MKDYYRVMLGKGSAYAEECFAGNFIGAGFIREQDLTGKLPEEWRAFNKEFIPVYLATHPEKSKVSAGLACGFLWTVAKGIRQGDIVLCPDGSGMYKVAEVAGEYRYVQGADLPHQRPVTWRNEPIERSSMSEALRNSAGSVGTVSKISGYAEEIEALLQNTKPAVIVSTDPDVEDPSEFALEKHLEDFLVSNWPRTELGKDYDIFAEDGEKVGQQYPTDTGPIDILAVSKDKKQLLVVELKKGRATDVALGQLLRYMGYVDQELADNGQEVKGVIIGLEDDQKLKRALSVAPNVSFYRYEIRFKLLPS